MAKIRTVLGDISPDEFGPALVHEHILVDFIEAEKFSRERYNREEVFEVMLPYLARIKNLGVKGFVECTPAYMGRDPELLVRFSKALGIHILTNTGLTRNLIFQNLLLSTQLINLQNYGSKRFWKELKTPILRQDS